MDKVIKNKKRKKKNNIFVTGLTTQPLQYGWICPKCGAVLSPWTCSCPRCSPIDVTPRVTWTDTDPFLRPTTVAPYTTYTNDTGTDKPITKWSFPTSSATTVKSKSQMEELGW